MENKFYKLVTNKIKYCYIQFLPHIISLALLLICSLSLFVFDGWISLLGLAILLFGFLPLFLSFILLSTRTFVGKSFSYNDIYLGYSRYFHPLFRKTFSILKILFLTLLSMYLLLTIFIFIISYDNPKLILEIYETMDVNLIRNYKYFDLGNIIIYGLSLLIFLFQLVKKVKNPYLIQFSGVFDVYLRKYDAFKKPNKYKQYEKNIYPFAFILLGIYLLTYFSSSIIAYNYFDVEKAIVIGIFISILSCFLFFPFYLGATYYISMHNKECADMFINKEIIKEFALLDKDTSISEEDKNLIKQKFKEFEEKHKKYLQEHQNKDDDKKE